jgi:hypothetical protein
MYLIELNKVFSDLDRDIIEKIQEAQSKMSMLLQEHASKNAKYILGTTFTHPKFGECHIHNLEVQINKNKLMSFDYPLLIEEDYYNPYYVYLAYNKNLEKDTYLRLTEQEITKFIENNE